MGSKFSNINIRTNDLLSVENALKEFSKKSGKGSPNFPDGILPKNNLISGLLDLFNTSQHKYYAGCMTEGWVTVLNEWFGWESIKDAAIDLSEYLTNPILTTGYFDDDVFELALVREGQILTSHVSGGGLDFYDLVPRLGIVEIFIEELGLNPDSNKLRDILEMNDLYKKAQELEQFIGVPIIIDGDGIDEEPQEVKSKFKTLRF